MPRLMPASPLGPVKIAVTVDDLLSFRKAPTVAGVTQFDVARGITSALQRNGVAQVYGFSNTAPAEDDASLLKVFDLWMTAGHHVANHTHHHASINWLESNSYIADIERAEQYLGQWLDQAPVRYFRYCMDMWGDTAEKYEAVAAYLSRANYKAAPISIGFHDAVWMVHYARIVKRATADEMAWLRRSYVDTAEHQLRLHAANARAVFGRDPAHIWMIHGTPIAAACLDQILDRFAAMGVEFISIDEAMADPMNSSIPPRVAPEFIHQVEKWAMYYNVPVDDRHPAIMAKLEEMYPIPGEGSADFWKAFTGSMAERVGAKPAPFPRTPFQEH